MPKNIAKTPELPTHPRAQDPPHGALWRRAGRRRFDPMPRTHAELVVLLGLAGRARYLLDGQVLTMGRGSVIWALSGQAHMLLSESQGFDMWVVLAGRDLWVGDEDVPAIADAPGQGGLRQLAPDAVAELDALAAAVQTCAAPAALGAGLRWWLTRAHAFWQDAVNQRAPGTHPAVARAALILQDHPDSPIATIAARAGLSPSRLRALFKAQTGQGLSEFRRAQRLERVDRAVWDGQALLPAALDAGWGSYAQFFRDFKAARRQSPRHWYRDRT